MEIVNMAFWGVPRGQEVIAKVIMERSAFWIGIDLWALEGHGRNVTFQ
jgi:hypothetical protein